MKRILSIVAIALSITANASATDPAPSAPEQHAIRNASCETDNIVGVDQTGWNVVCHDGKWQAIGQTSQGNTDNQPFYFDGKCALNFDEATFFGQLFMKPKQVSDVCLPSGWTITAVVESEDPSIDLKTRLLSSVGNLALLEAYGHFDTTLWIYAKTPGDNRVKKFTVALSAK